jgi:hypothetical protein
MGQTTQARFAQAFAVDALITAKAAAELIGLDVKTLREMSDAGVIRFVIVGASTRKYAEGDLAAYVAGQRFGEIKPCPSTSAVTPRISITTSNSKVIGFTAARASARARKPSK